MKIIKRVIIGIFATWLIGCNLGKQSNSVASTLSKTKQSDQLNQFIDTLSIGNQPFTFKNDTVNILQVMFLWSEDSNCQDIAETTSFSGDVRINNSRIIKYMLTPLSYDYFHMYDGNYKDKEFNQIFKSFRVELITTSASGETITVGGKECYKVNKKTILSYVMNNDFKWPTADPCYQQMGMPIAHEDKERRWHTSLNSDVCSEDLKSSGLLNSTRSKITGEPPHGGFYCSCNYVMSDGKDLKACCADNNGNWKVAEFKNYLAHCYTGETISNINGHLTCNGKVPIEYNPKLYHPNGAPYYSSKITCTFDSTSGEKDNLDYHCIYQDGADYEVRGTKFNPTECSNESELFLPDYRLLNTNKRYLGHLECKETKDYIPGDDSYLKALLNGSDTYIHADNDGHYYLDLYSVTKDFESGVYYNSQKFDSLANLKEFVNMHHPMNADGYMVLKDEEDNVRDRSNTGENVKHGYLYWGNKQSGDDFQMKKTRDWVLKDGNDHSCKLTQFYWGNDGSLSLREKEETRTIIGLQSVGKVKEIITQDDGNIVIRSKKNKDHDAGSDHGLSISTDNNESSTEHEYQVFHLESYQNTCALVTVRGVRRYQYINLKSELDHHKHKGSIVTEQVIWNNYTESHNLYY